LACRCCWCRRSSDSYFSTFLQRSAGWGSRRLPSESQETSVDAFREFNRRVFDEDLPLDVSAEIAIPADRTSVAYRRLRTGLGLSRVYVG
jgi:hypothetical protein